MNPYPLNILNKIFPSKQTLYDILENSPEYGFKLPSYSSKAVTIKYLMAVANEEVFLIKKVDYKEIKTKSCLSKVDYFAELGKMRQNLGFDIHNLPDKKWLKNCLFSIKPDHPFFEVQILNQREINER
jgi:hypothetical protein